MEFKLSDRALKPDFQGEFIDSILQAAADPSITSFAGGLPNSASFPVKEIEAAAHKVLEQNGVQSLQYSNTQGYLPLRKFIAERYKKLGVDDVKPEDIIITNGSQQALNMMSAVMLNPGDEIVVEEPTFLGALQCFHLCDPTVLSVKLNDDGMDCDELEKLLNEHNPKFMYVIPNFQNPTGLTYTEEVRERVSEIVRKHDVIVLEDNPYNELRYRGTASKSFGYYLGEQCCMLGTFSKIVSPGMRIGWITVKNEKLRAILLNYKSTMDLHTNIFCQMVLAQYLADNDLDAHVDHCKELYQAKCNKMLSCLREYMPAEVSFTEPDGGMFIWATLPEGVSSVDVFNAALENKIAICPGDPFYETKRGVNTMRLNYSNATDEQIDAGIKALADAIRKLMK